MNNESFYMHSRYDEFTAFLKALETDAKITPSTKHLAFDVWLASTINQFFNDRPPHKTDLLNENMVLKAQLNALQNMNTALTESNEILKQALNEVSE